MAFRSLFVIAGSFAMCAVAPFGALAADTSLDTVFARMDKAAVTFRAMTADIKRAAHTELVDANDVEEGTIAVKRSKSSDVRLLIDFQKPVFKKVFIGGGKVLIYNPEAKIVQEYDLGKHRSLVNEFLLLGFGANSADLKKSYTITLGAPETVNGVSATRIELVPLAREVLNQLKKAELWIPENGVPIQQKFYTGGGDYQICSYSKPVINPNLPELKLDVPKGVKKIN